MSLLETEFAPGRHWQRVGDAYAVTKKPRGLDLGSMDSIPFAAMEAIPQGGAYDATFTPKAPGSITSGTYFEHGDVLVGKITPSFENGKQAYAANLPQAFGYATTEVIPLHPKSDHHDPRLLFFYLLHPDIRHYIAERMEGSTGRQRVPDNVLLDLPMPAFEKDDQTHMANALELIHRAITAESQSEANARELKNSAMRELFSRGLGGEAQKGTDIGVMPQSWSPTSIDAIAKRTQYGLSQRGQSHGATPILRMNCQLDGKAVFRDLQFVDLDEATFADFKLEPGDILFNRTNSIEHVGRTAIFESEKAAVFASYLVRLTVDKDRCDPRFLNHYMNWPHVQSEIKKLASRAVGQANINASKLRTVIFPLPPTLEEQAEIVDVLDAIDRKIDLHKRKRAVLEELFRTLLHKLMTGEIDVNDLDLSALPAANA